MEAQEQGTVGGVAEELSKGSAASASRPDPALLRSPAPPLSIDAFVGEPTRDLASWRRLWKDDLEFPIRSHRGLLGRVLVAFKRLFRPLVKVPQNDLWERQRIFNLIVLEHLERLDAHRDKHHDRLVYLEELDAKGIEELMAHNDALFARVDQKVDRLRREARDLLGSLSGALAVAEQAAARDLGVGGVGGARGAVLEPPLQNTSAINFDVRAVREPPFSEPAAVREPPFSEPAAVREPPLFASVDALSRAREEHAYLELERRYRGTEEEIGERISRYLPWLERLEKLPVGKPALDLGCGRGEFLALLQARGIPARGVDSSARMVAHCRERGLDAEVGDLFEALAAAEAGSLSAVASFHVIEHLPSERIETLVRLASHALAPGGVLILETPNPLSMVVAARNFWLDPTHRRPIHPQSLALQFELAGFDPVERLDLRPFPDAERLPEIHLADLPSEQRPLADRVNRLRDRLDDLLFGCQDYGMVGIKAREAGKS